jgi:hypothetical protein
MECMVTLPVGKADICMACVGSILGTSDWPLIGNKTTGKRVIRRIILVRQPGFELKTFSQGDALNQ